MKRAEALLFPAALGASALIHLLLLLSGPLGDVRPVPSPPEPFRVRLLQPARPAARVPAAASQEAARLPPPAPLPVEPELPRQEPRAPLELAPPEPTTGPLLEHTPGPNLAGEEALNRADTAVAAALSAEAAATQALRTSLRARVVERISYPPLARARHWRGTVLLAVVLDGEGRLQSLEVRRSSGYAVLDRAAAALLKQVTPVPNPLGRPLALDFPIEYALED